MSDLILTFIQPIFLIKIVAIILVVMVLIFVVITSKEVFDMNGTIQQGRTSRIVEIISIINIFLFFSLLLTAIVIL